MKYKIIFFGSFQHYSVIVLNELTKHHEIIGVVTTPPKPAGRHLQLKSTDVARYAKDHGLPLYELESLKDVPAGLDKPDFLIVAGYGKLIPKMWLDFPARSAINMHPSLLPAYPGPMPGEWAILNGETMTGVTLLTMTDKFDAGEIILQSPLEISPHDTRETLYDRAFSLGADLLITALNETNSGTFSTRPQPETKNPFYARKLTREDGFVPYEEFALQLQSSNIDLQRKWRALTPWPGVWTLNPAGQRIKLINPATKEVTQTS